MSSIGKLMKQAARMQQQMEANPKRPGQAHGRSHQRRRRGKVVAKCDGTIASIKIDPQAINPADAQLLEDMILTAANQALVRPRKFPTPRWAKPPLVSICRD